MGISQDRILNLLRVCDAYEEMRETIDRLASESIASGTQEAFVSNLVVSKFMQLPKDLQDLVLSEKIHFRKFAHLNARQRAKRLALASGTLSADALPGSLAPGERKTRYAKRKGRTGAQPNAQGESLLSGFGLPGEALRAKAARGESLTDEEADALSRACDPSQQDEGPVLDI
jgi:hypothetical protein